MGHQQKLNAALKNTRAFIESLAENATTSDEWEHSREVYFWQVDEGAIYLHDEEAHRYRELLDELVGVPPAAGQVSTRAVEKALQTAILKAIDIRRKQTETLDMRLARVIQELHQFFTRAPQVFRVFCRSRGLALEGLPSKVGNVEFLVFDEAQLDVFRAAVATHRVSEEQKESRYQLIAELGEEEDFGGRVVAAIEVSANDGDAARSLAVRELRLTVDVLNFFSDLVPCSRAYVSLPGDAQGENVVVPFLIVEGSKKTNFSINHETWGRRGELSLPKLWEVESQRGLGFARINSLLCGSRNALEERIIASLQWAGRATAEAKREEAFLLYAIALESLVLSDNIATELTYRLRLRIAHLLGENTESRRELFAEVGHLYNIRSKIVHSGSFQVTDADLSTLRAITKSALIRVSTKQEFLLLSHPKELADWFEGRVLE